MKNLKGWWKEVIEESSSNDDAKKIGGSSNKVVPSRKQHLSSLQFIKLKEMVTNGCPNLTVLSLCPKLERLELYETNKKLSLLKMAPIENPSSSMQPCSKLKHFLIEDVDNLISLTQLGGLGQLSELYLFDNKLESTEILREVFATLSSSLRYLQLQGKSLRYISKGLEHLTALEDMVLYSCEELELEEGARDESYDEKDLMPWIAFKTSLHTLQFWSLPKVANLPTGLQQLTNLHSLYLQSLEELREIPDWINCLSSLQYLELEDCPKLTSLPQSLQKLTSLYELLIIECPGLTKRCQRPNGTDWPKIQHIPRVYVRD